MSRIRTAGMPFEVHKTPMTRIISIILRVFLSLLAGIFFSRIGGFILGPFGVVLGFIFGTSIVGRIRIGTFRYGNTYSGEQEQQWRQSQERARRAWEQWQNYGGGWQQGGYSGSASSSASGRNAGYELLGVSPSASDDEVKAAYRNLALKYHPDRYAGRPESERAAAEEKFKAINAAWEAIKNERNL